VHKVFLCHSSSDKEFVRKLAQDLNAQNLSVWIDEREILVGDPIRQKIEEGLQASDNLAIVLSPTSVQSAWVQKELDAKLVEEIESKRVSVLPILYKQCAIPPFLKGKHYANFTKEYGDGLNDLLARFKQSDRETEAKRKVLQRLAGESADRVDPHALIGLALSAPQLDAAEELLSIHQAAHPKCPVVPQIQASIDLIRHESKGTPESWIRALDGALGLIRHNAVPQHFQNLDRLCSIIPADESRAEAALRTLELCLDEIEAGRLGWAPTCAGMLLKACHKLPLKQAAIRRVCLIAHGMISTLDVTTLRPCMSHLLHVGTHLAQKLTKDEDRQEVLRALFQSGRIKVQKSSDYSDAFLHLAWAAALLGNRSHAKDWLDQYRLTVTASSFIDKVKKHSPLESLAASSPPSKQSRSLSKGGKKKTAKRRR
jgi:hypothetical protein